jgi:integrase
VLREYTVAGYINGAVAFLFMKQRYRMFLRGRVFYAEDTTTGRQESLRTSDSSQARRLLAAKNESQVQPALNLQIARVYLSATDPEIRTRTWQHVMDIMATTKEGSTLKRWQGAIKDKAFNSIRCVTLLETCPEHFLLVLKSGTVSTNVFLRRLHNFVLDMSWVACPIIPKRQWPGIEYADKRAVTADEHQKIITGERNPEWRAFYELCWHTGGAQTDVSLLTAESIDWEMRVISFTRSKTGSRVELHFGDGVATLLKELPTSGPLFPHLAKMNQSDRGIAFTRRCKLVGVSGVTLHSYRYAWAERAKTCGYPERFAQLALGHNSKAVHRAYAAKAKVLLPSLETYERQFAERVVKLKPKVA